MKKRTQVANKLSHAGELKSSVCRHYQHDAGQAYEARRFVNFLGQAEHLREVQAFRNLVVDLPKYRRALDAGCGTGRFSLEMRALGFHVTALDQSPAMLRRLRDRSSESQLAICISQGDIEQLPFADESFDLVLAIRVLTHFENPYDALIEFTRVTKVGGNIIVDANNAFRLDWPLVLAKRLGKISVTRFRQNVYTSYLLPGQIKNLYTADNLRLVKQIGLNYVPGPKLFARILGMERLLSIDRHLQAWSCLSWFGSSVMIRLQRMY